MHIYVMMEPIYPFINVFLYVMHESQATLALCTQFPHLQCEDNNSTYCIVLCKYLGFPGGAVKEFTSSAGDSRDMGLIPRSGIISWRKKWEPTLIVPGKLHRPKNLEDYSPGSHKDLDMTDHTHTWQV